METASLLFQSVYKNDLDKVLYNEQIYAKTILDYSRLISMSAFVWDQSGIRIIGIIRVSICLGAILIPAILPSEQNSQNIFRNIFLFRNIPNERTLSGLNGNCRTIRLLNC